MKQTFSIDLGGLGLPIADQLHKVGLRVEDEDSLAMFERARQAMNTLWVRGFLAEAEKARIGNRLAWEIEQAAAPLPLPGDP